MLIVSMLTLNGAATVDGTDSRQVAVETVEKVKDQVHPQPPEERQIRLDAYTLRQKNIRREIEKGRQEVEVTTRKEADTLKRLNQVELALNKSKKRAALLSKEIKDLDTEISEALKTSEALGKRIQANEEYVARRLVAMYKMSWLGTIHLLASAESFQELLERKAALQHILAYDEKLCADLVRNQTELERVLDRLETHKTQKSERAKAYAEQTRQMSEERSMRQKLLADIRSQKALELAAIEALTQAADDLDDKITSLHEEIKNENQEKIALQSPFSAHKGLLIMPVKGRIISLFGPFKNQKYNITNFRSGIDIKADKGEPIRSVFNGKVLYCDWFKGYGNMIIIDHGNNYYTVYAHLEETFKSKGDHTETGEVIATVGDTGSMEGDKLYFEVRHHGKPVDPLIWLKKG